MVLTNVTSYESLQQVPAAAYANSAFATFAALSETFGDDALSDTQQALQAGLARSLVSGTAAYSELATDQPSAQAIYEFVSVTPDDKFDIDAERADQQGKVWKDVIKSSSTTWKYIFL